MKRRVPGPAPRPARWLRVACRLLWMLLSLPLPALAWNGAGHRLVACIAWEQLGTAQRAELARLLRRHPDYARWQRHAGADDPARTAFIEASTWPDDIRKDARFYSAGIDAPTPTLPGFPDMERHRDWHGVSYPLSGSETDEQTTHGMAISGRLDRALVELAQTFATDAATRSYALPWLIHLVGDAHQPLHTSVRVDANGEVDARGRIVINPYLPRKTTTSIHAYWDDLPGPPWLRGERLDNACRSLTANVSAPPPSSSAQWLEESWQIARQTGYPPTDEDPPTISAQFNDRARQIARQRIALAGYRLADLLRELLIREK